jgi:hypothetical protein
MSKRAKTARVKRVLEWSDTQIPTPYDQHHASSTSIFICSWFPPEMLCSFQFVHFLNLDGLLSKDLDTLFSESTLLVKPSNVPEKLVTQLLVLTEDWVPVVTPDLID